MSDKEQNNDKMEKLKQSYTFQCQYSWNDVLLS